MFPSLSTLLFLMRFLIFSADSKSLDFNSTNESLESIQQDHPNIEENTTALINTNETLNGSQNAFELEVQNENSNKVNSRQRRCLYDLFSSIMTDVNVGVRTRPIHSHHHVYEERQVIPEPQVVVIDDSMKTDSRIAWDYKNRRNPNRGNNRYYVPNDYDDDDDDDNDDDDDDNDEDDDDTETEEKICKDLAKWENKFDEFVEQKADNGLVYQRRFQLKKNFKISQNHKYASLKKNIFKISNVKKRKLFLLRLKNSFKRVVTGKKVAKKHQNRRRQRKNLKKSPTHLPLL